MKLCLDVEANGLEDPTEIWLIVCKDVDTGQLHIFRNVTSNEEEKQKFLSLASECSQFIGHHILGYDVPVIHRLIGIDLSDRSLDTLIISKLVDYSREGGHSVEQYGTEFGEEKKTFYKFTDKELYNSNSILFKQLEDYCLRDVEISLKIYLKYLKVIKDTQWKPSIELEHKFQLVVNSLHTNGFSFNKDKAEKLLTRVLKELEVLDEAILKEFPPKLKMIREVTPEVTKHGTLHRKDFRFVTDGDLSEYNGGPFCRCKWEPFNPSSHRQIIDILNSAGWSPVDLTQTHIDTKRRIQRIKYSRERTTELDLELQECYDKLKILEKTGYKINENNLNTLPDTAPSPARTLAKRILLEARRRTLVEWLGLVHPDTQRIHGSFYGIGAWTHRMAHQHPNTANIPTDAKLYGGEMRSLWRAPKNRLLVGVDAEGIQLRIFAHYIDDKEFTDALVNGKKSDGSDPHSLNQRILGSKSRNIAKRFIFAYLLGAGVGKLAQILELPEDEARRALDRLVERYEGLAHLKNTIIPVDARHGWFLGLDGRRVAIPGKTSGERKHLCMSGYLQNGEAIVMKKATLLWLDKLKHLDNKIKFVNFVHDEWQTEVPNDMDIALEVAKAQADSLREVGEIFKLKCPLAGSYWSEDLNDYTIGTNWHTTH